MIVRIFIYLRHLTSVFISYTHTYDHKSQNHRATLFPCPAWKLCVWSYEDANKATEEQNTDYVLFFLNLCDLNTIKKIQPTTADTVHYTMYNHQDTDFYISPKFFFITVFWNPQFDNQISLCRVNIIKKPKISIYL